MQLKFGVMILMAFLGCKGQIQKDDTGENVIKFLDIQYADLSVKQKLDIYLPENDDANKPYPVIVSIHGGAFMMGDKADGQLNPMLEGLKRGYAVVSINYRLSDECIFPCQVQDVKTAIRWIKANAGKYNFNPDKIAAWGGSAGGYLASMAGTSAGVKEFEGSELGNAGFSSNVQAIVDWFGPIDFLTMDKHFMESGKGEPDHNEAGSPESKLMGTKITEIPDKVQWANPENYISGDDPVFLVQHGTEDKLVPVQQSGNFAKKLKEALGEEKVTIQLLEGVGHGGKEFGTEENLNLVFNFLDNVLK